MNYFTSYFNHVQSVHNKRLVTKTLIVTDQLIYK